jgi:hypothetical protein
MVSDQSPRFSFIQVGEPAVNNSSRAAFPRFVFDGLDVFWHFNVSAMFPKKHVWPNLHSGGDGQQSSRFFNPPMFSPPLRAYPGGDWLSRVRQTAD